MPRLAAAGVIPLLLVMSCTSPPSDTDAGASNPGSSEPAIDRPGRASEWDDLCETLGLASIERDFGIDSYTVIEAEEFEDALGCGVSISPHDGHHSIQLNLFLWTFAAADGAVEQFHAMTDPEYARANGSAVLSYRMGLPHDQIQDTYFDAPWHLGMIRSAVDPDLYDEVHGVGQYDAIVLGSITRFYNTSADVCELGGSEESDCTVGAEDFQRWLGDVFMPQVLEQILERYDAPD